MRNSMNGLSISSVSTYTNTEIAYSFVDWSTRIVASMSNAEFSKMSDVRHVIGQLNAELLNGFLTLAQAEDEFLSVIK